MPDLVVPPGPGIPDGLIVPGEDLVERFSRSSGPGGQSVNTADTRVEIVLDLTTTSAFDERLRARAVRALGTDVLRVTASEHRSQLRNREAARERLTERLRTALAPPPPARVPTKPSKGARRRRLDTKKRRGQVKELRRRVDPSG